VNDVLVLNPAEKRSHHLINGKRPAVILVRVRNHSIRYSLFYVLVHIRSVFIKFWNYNRNHIALIEAVTFLKQTLCRHVWRVMQTRQRI